MSKLPIVSVIVTTKNSAKTLEACLTSVEQQTYKKVELVVVDNYSEDNTQEIAKQYTNHVFSKGPERSSQRNYAVEQASGFYVFIIDSDMELDPTVVEECVAEMMKLDDCVGVIVPEESFGEGFWAQCKKLERSFYVGVSYMEAARFFKKTDFVNVGGYNTAMVSGEDWDLSQRIEALGSFSRTSSIIHHNEGRISLRKTVGKKFYYARKFSSYIQGSNNTNKTAQQTSIFGRYALFFSKPKLLFSKPVIGVGMLFMKTCEFGFGGLGLLFSKLRK